MTTTARIEPANRRRLLAMSWSHLLNDGAANYLPGVLPVILIAMGEPVRMAGAFMAALIVGQALQPVTGWVADRTGGRSLTTLGLFLSSLGAALLGVAPSTPVLIVVLLMIGAGGALFHPQALAGVRSMVRGRQGLPTSVFLVGGELGRGIWPTAASLVVTGLGLGWLWLVGLPGLLTVPLLFMMAPRLPPKPPRAGRIQWRRHARPMATLVAYRSVQAFTTFVLVTFIPIMWHLRGGSLVRGASIITAMITVGVVGNLWGGHLADQVGRRPVLVISSIATTALILPTVYLPGAWVWVCAALLGSAIFLTASTTVLIGQDIFPENRSMGSGIALGLANGIGSVLVLAAGLWVGDTHVMSLFWLVAGLGLVNLALAFSFPGHLVQRGAPPGHPDHPDHPDSRP
ncbi:MAG: MFS transporter [Micrococcales bacterium]|nr:MFS transporter [Micrococcales bacterium]